MKRLVKEPLLHFLLLGALIFAVYQWRQGPTDEGSLVVNAATVEQLANQYRKTWLKEPDRKTLQQAIDNHIANQMFAERAFAMDMHKDDPVVARRMRMKLEMLNDLSVEPATKEEVSAYFEDNAQVYASGARYSLEQRFFSKATPAAELTEVLQALQNGSDMASQPSLFNDHYEDTSEQQLARAFGSAFVDQIVALPLAVWQGPMASPLGWHFIKLTQRIEASPPSLDTIYSQVQRDATEAKRAQARATFQQQLIDSRQVVIKWPENLQ